MTWYLCHDFYSHKFETYMNLVLNFFSFVSTSDVFLVSKFALKLQFWPPRFLCMGMWCLQIMDLPPPLPDTSHVIFLATITQELKVYEVMGQYKSKIPELLVLLQKILEAKIGFYLCACYKKTPRPCLPTCGKPTHSTIQHDFLFRRHEK